MLQPSYFRQAGIPWSIIWNSDNSFDEDFRGRTLLDKYEMHINANLPPETQRMALLHELLHLCSDVQLMDKQRLTEGQIRVVAQNLFEIFYHNEEIGIYLVKG